MSFNSTSAIELYESVKKSAHLLSVTSEHRSHSMFSMQAVE